MIKIILISTALLLISHAAFAKPKINKNGKTSYEENSNFDIVQFEKEEGIVIKEEPDDPAPAETQPEQEAPQEEPEPQNEQTADTETAPEEEAAQEEPSTLEEPSQNEQNEQTAGPETAPEEEATQEEPSTLEEPSQNEQNEQTAGPETVPEQEAPQEEPEPQNEQTADTEALPEDYTEEYDAENAEDGDALAENEENKKQDKNDDEKELLTNLPKGIDLVALMQKENLLEIPRRILEVGFKVDAGLSNNFFTAKEFLQKDLVIDLHEMADDVPAEGWQIDFLVNSELYFNMNITRTLQVGFANGVEACGFMNLSKKLFDYLGNGFNLYEILKVDGDIDADAFFYTQAKLGFSYKGFHFTAKPALVKPLVHVETDEMYGTYNNPEDGSVNLKVLALVKFYGGTDLEPILENNFSFGDLASNLFKDCGFDLELAAEHKVFDALQAGVFARIPMIPGTLSYTADCEFSFDYQVAGLKALMQGDYEDPDFNSDNKKYGTGSYKLHRPLRTGLELAWRPFGEWATFRGMVGLGVKKPYTSDAKAFVEYKLGYDVLLLNTIGAWISTGYFNEIYKHELGLIFNFRVAEIDLGVSFQGSNIKYSFTGSGAGAFLNLCFGF